MCGLVVVGCDDSAVEGLKGRWTGSIACTVGAADVTLGLRVQGDRIVGDAITRSNKINSDWRVEGAQRELQRNTACRDDTCVTDDDCVDRGGGTCNEHGICDPCEVTENWRRVTLVLIDADVQSPNPEMRLERFGDQRLVGEIEAFCPGDPVAGVELDKQE